MHADFIKGKNQDGHDAMRTIKFNSARKRAGAVFLGLFKRNLFMLSNDRGGVTSVAVQTEGSQSACVSFVKLTSRVWLLHASGTLRGEISAKYLTDSS
jgi:hypothetical protein